MRRNGKIKNTNANIRYISGGKDAQLERFTIPIKFVTAERNAVPNAARNIPSPLAGIVKNLQTLTRQYYNKIFDNGTKQKRTEYK